MKAVTMLVMVMAVVVMMGERVEGRRRGHWARRRGCRRAEGEGVMQDGLGSYYIWTMTGLDQDDLRMTYHQGAFVPEGARVVFLFPRDRGQRALGLVPAKFIYDFTDPSNPVVAIRKARRGRGVCIVMRSDVTSYDDMLTQLQERNMTNREVVSEDEVERLALGEPSDPSQFSGTLRDICSQDLCGNHIDTIYFWAQEQDPSVAEEEENQDDDDEEEADSQGAMSHDHSYMLFNERVAIAVQQPRRRMWHRSRKGPGMRQRGDPSLEARLQRRQQRRQQRQQRRQLRRQARLE